MNIFDAVPARTLDAGEADLQIIVTPKGKDALPDPLENVDVADLGTQIRVTGLSHLTGDTATYFLAPDDVVELWAL